MNQKPTVFVGLSGGVDSSVAALRLKTQGYDVVGVFIKVWHPEWMVCNWEAERLDAMRVAAALDIPFLTCDAVDAYRDAVANQFIAAYDAGITPNPDVLCNQHVKFGAFLKFAKAHGAAFIATGHYAQNITQSSGVHTLVRGVDSNKDQSYFLWTLTQFQLAHTLLPVGDTTKADIRAEAAAAGLPTSTKRDSQGICFLGHVDIPKFLGHYITLRPGPVLSESGAVIGEHQGAVIYTLGQRHGFTLFADRPRTEPHYVVGRSVPENTLTVSTHRPAFSSLDSFTIHTTNWIEEPPRTDETVLVQTRYRQQPIPMQVRTTAGNTAQLTPTLDFDRPVAGQSAVCYRGQRCIGGGIIGTL